MRVPCLRLVDGFVSFAQPTTMALLLLCNFSILPPMVALASSLLVPRSPLKTPIPSLSISLCQSPPPSLRAKPISIVPPSAALPPQKYVYPDPDPQFAESETLKFRTELSRKLSKDKETFGDDLDEVVDVCSEIFSDFLKKEYGGPGTLLVEPFTEMLVALKERKLPGAPLAARASLLWAQNYVDQDWDDWNSSLPY